MKSNTITALLIEIPSKNNDLSGVLLKIQRDAQSQAEEYVKSAKVDLGGE